MLRGPRADPETHALTLSHTRALPVPYVPPAVITNRGARLFPVPRTLSPTSHTRGRAPAPSVHHAHPAGKCPPGGRDACVRSCVRAARLSDASLLTAASAALSPPGPTLPRS